MIVSYITVNFHSDSDTLSVVSDLTQNKLEKDTQIKIFVVDNSGSKDLKQKLSSFPSAHYVDSPGNVGFAAGNNLGLKAAIKSGTDLLVLINNDTIIPKDLTHNIILSKIFSPGVGIVGGLIYFAKGFEFEKEYSEKERGKVIWYAGGKLDWQNVYGSHRGVNEVDHGQYQQVEPTDFVTGCLLITKPSVIAKIGLIDERYCLYHEDTDFNLRVQRSGLSTIFDPNIKIWHKVAQSSAIGSPLNDYFLTRNRLLLGFSYASFRTRFALLREAVKKIFVGTKAQRRAVVDFLIGNLGKGSWLK